MRTWKVTVDYEPPAFAREAVTVAATDVAAAIARAAEDLDLYAVDDCSVQITASLIPESTPSGQSAQPRMSGGER